MLNGVLVTNTDKTLKEIIERKEEDKKILEKLNNMNAKILKESKSKK